MIISFFFFFSTLAPPLFFKHHFNLIHYASMTFFFGFLPFLFYMGKYSAIQFGEIFRLVIFLCSVELKIQHFLILRILAKI